MTESDSLRTLTATIDDMFDSLEADPDKPADLDSVWRYAALGSRTLESGVWEASAATWAETGYPVEEVCVMLAGHLRLTDADGAVHDLRQGDAFHLPRGWAGTWEVVEDMRKFYVVLP